MARFLQKMHQRRCYNRCRLLVQSARNNIILHAVFISGFPNLPSACACSHLPAPNGTTISLDIKQLGAQPRRPIWHPTCNKEYKRYGNLALDFRWLGVASAPGRHSQPALPFLFCSGDAIKFTHAQACGVALKSAPHWRKSL